MDPLTLSALIGGGSQLLGGILGGFGSSANQNRDREFQERMARMQRGWQVRDRDTLEQKLKSSGFGSTPFFQSQNLPAFDRILAQAVMGGMREHGDPKWGIDFGDIGSVLGFDKKFSESADAQKYYGEDNSPRTMRPMFGKRVLDRPRRGMGRYGDEDMLPGYAAGGIVTRPSTVRVGEVGPEAIVPLGYPAPGLQRDAARMGFGGSIQPPGVPVTTPGGPAGLSPAFGGMSNAMQTPRNRNVAPGQPVNPMPAFGGMVNAMQTPRSTIPGGLDNTPGPINTIPGGPMAPPWRFGPGGYDTARQFAGMAPKAQQFGQQNPADLSRIKQMFAQRYGMTPAQAMWPQAGV